jgi:hypothetical protein
VYLPEYSLGMAESGPQPQCGAKADGRQQKTLHQWGNRELTNKQTIIWYRILTFGDDQHMGEDAYNQKIYAGRTGSMRKWKLIVSMYRGAEGAGRLKGRYEAAFLFAL